MVFHKYSPSTIQFLLGVVNFHFPYVNSDKVRFTMIISLEWSSLSLRVQGRSSGKEGERQGLSKVFLKRQRKGRDNFPEESARDKR